MEFPANKFKRRLRAGEQQVGLWSSLSSAAATEILADSGFDWILIDTEHAPERDADGRRPAACRVARHRLAGGPARLERSR